MAMDLINREYVVRGIQIAFFNLVIVGVIGCLLRFYFIHPISGFNFSYVLHAHSHLAFLGWVFMALYVLIIQAYLPIETANHKKYITLFVILQLANAGMLFTFPFMGYALWSITFSAIHAITAMTFAWVFIKEVEKDFTNQHKTSFQFVKWALILMFISNMAPFALGPVSAIQGKSDLYHSLIYFYLHFQYNGWFTFALIGTLLYQLEKKGVNTTTSLVKVGFMLKLNVVFPTYILSLLWLEPDPVWYALGGVAAFVQMIGLALILTFIFQHLQVLFRNHSDLMKVLFLAGVLAIGFQHILMVLSSIPSLGGLAFARNIVIAYLHLVLLGFVTSWVFYHTLSLDILKDDIVSRSGFGLFLSAFVATELILVFQGFVDHSSTWLFTLALLQLGGFVLIALSFKNIKEVV